MMLRFAQRPTDGRNAYEHRVRTHVEQLGELKAPDEMPDYDAINAYIKDAEAWIWMPSQEQEALEMLDAPVVSKQFPLRPGVELQFAISPELFESCIDELGEGWEVVDLEPAADEP